MWNRKTPLKQQEHTSERNQNVEMIASVGTDARMHPPRIVMNFVTTLVQFRNLGSSFSTLEMKLSSGAIT